MNKKITLSIILIAIIALALATWFVHNQICDLQNQIGALKAQNREAQDQLNELQNQLNKLQLQNREQQDRLGDFTYELAKERHLNVKITAFSWGGLLGFTGLMASYEANVTVENDDVVPLSGLKLVLRLVKRNTGVEIAYDSMTIGRIDVGESLEIRTGVESKDWGLNDTVCEVSITLAGVVFDRGTFELN